MIRHVVKQGECLSLIAVAYGFVDWRIVYDDGANADLRQKRPNPDVLFPGDVVTIPDRDPTPTAAATGKEHRFTVKTPKRRLKVRMLDEHKAPMKDAPYTAEVGDLMFCGATSDEGDLAIDLPADATQVTIWIACQVRVLQLGVVNPIEHTPDDGVSGVQGRLDALGFDPGALDGLMGPHTRAAIVAFQRHFGIEVTGEPDAATRARLEKELGA